MVAITKPAQNSGKNSRMPEGRRFRKGQSGNPGGRPKSAHIREAVLDYLSQPGKMQEAIERLYKEDLKTFFAYGYGKPTESIELSAEFNDRQLAVEIAAELVRNEARR